MPPVYWDLRIESSLDEEAAFQGAHLLHRIAGWPLALARGLMADLPVTLAMPLYRYQAHRLERELRGLRLKVRLEKTAEQGGRRVC